LERYRIEEDEWRPEEDVRGSKWLAATFHQRNPKAPQHISALDFTNLPFCLLTNFINISDTVPAEWATSTCMLGHCQEQVFQPN